MNQHTPAQLREVYDRHGGDAEKIRQELGLSALEFADQATPVPLPVFRRRKAPVDVGQDYFRKYIVSTRHAMHPTWPSEDQSAIDAARVKYEAGTHTVCQGRDRDWFVLYCVPLETRVGARKFFRTEFS